MDALSKFYDIVNFVIHSFRTLVSVSLDRQHNTGGDNGNGGKGGYAEGGSKANGGQGGSDNQGPDCGNGGNGGIALDGTSANGGDGGNGLGRVDACGDNGGNGGDAFDPASQVNGGNA